MRTLCSAQGILGEALGTVSEPPRNGPRTFSLLDQPGRLSFVLRRLMCNLDILYSTKRLPYLSCFVIFVLSLSAR
jgi:hypothetical protein